MSILDPDREVYLGDGLYASYDGYQIALRADRDLRMHVVYLEPGVLVAFLKYANELGAAIIAARRDELARKAGT